MDNLLRDIRYTMRTLLRKPGFSVVIVLALAVGIGADTLIFSVVDAVLLRPLPFRDADRLIQIWSTNPSKSMQQVPLSLQDYLDYRDRVDSIEQAAVFRPVPFNLTGIDEPERVWGAGFSGDLFDLLGVPPALGRTFGKNEILPMGGGRLVVIGNGLWRRRFGAAPDVIGMTIGLNGENYQIIGVMPPSFQFPQPGQFAIEKPSELWIPLGYDLSKIGRGTRAVGMVARLKPGTSLSRAATEITSMANAMEEQFPATNSGIGARVVPLLEQVTGSTRRPLLILLGAVSFVLLIACTNVANLLLVKANAQHQEISVRVALGATRGRLIRQLLTESAVYSLLSGVFGLGLAYLGIQVVRAVNPGNIARLMDVTVDGRVMAFTLIIASLTAVIFGLVPALEASRPDLTESLKEGGRSTQGRKRHRLRSALAVVEVSLSLVLLIGAGLLIKSFLRLQNIDPGFNASNLLTVEISLPRNKYPDPAKRALFVRQTLAQIEGQPGVEAVTAGAPLPLSGSEEVNGFSVEGQPPETPDSRPLGALRSVAPDYFRLMGIPLLSGREFVDQDAENAPAVAIINENLAKRLFQGVNPVGKRITFGNPGQSAWISIVGVVADVRHSGMGLKSDLGFEIYRPYYQEPWPIFSIAARTTSDPASLAPSFRARIMEQDRDLPAYNIRTMDQLLAASVAQPRFYMLLLVVLAFVALVLATVGVYSVISYSVSQRHHEIGIRMALGATPTDVVKLVLKQGVVLAIIGTLIGLTASFVMTRVISTLLFEVSITDPVAFGGATILLIAVALLASFVPAYRATRVDPISVLHYQ